MGMFYCHGCDLHHDSKDGEYNVAKNGKEYCDETFPFQSIVFTIKGKEFWIDKFDEGFMWVSETAEGGLYPEPWQAQQEALDLMRGDGFEGDLSFYDDMTASERHKAIKDMYAEILA